MTNPLHTTLGRTLAVVCTWLLCVTPAWAKPAHKKALADYFGPFLPKKLNDCRTCHVAEQPGQEDDKPHNVFGERLKAVRKELGRAGKTNDLAACLDALATEDSDGDGAANLTELLAGRYPGEADDRPTPAEVETAAVKLPGLRKLRNGYPWRPFQTVQRPPVPQVKNAAWVRNPIDAFIAAEHEERGLQPRPEAARPVLVRRVYLDLLGLPPTRDELRAAVEDQAADWYEQLVDKLLASPRHGERWGRHWMDVWRYSDWYGYNGEIRHSQPHVWRWRDWIVEAVNADKGYDRMLVEMLAGDELAPDDPDVVRATGYLVRNYNRHHRDKWLQETVDHTFQAFLGLTIGCARCHDHMYDPLSQQDYYQVRAFFEPHQVRIDQLPGKLDPVKIDNLTIPGNGLARVYDADGKAPTYLFTRGDETKPDKSAVIMPGVPKSLGGELPAIAPVRLPASAFDPEKRDWVIREQVESATAARDRAAAGRETSRRQVVLAAGLLIGGEPLANAMALPTLQKSLDALGAADLDAELTDARHAALLTVLHAERLEDSERFGTDEWRTAAFAAAAVQRRLAVAEARKALLVAQQAHQTAAPAARPELAKRVASAEKGLAVAQDKLQAKPTADYTPRPIKSYPETSTGRRLALARWIAHADNPLTARVAVNHLWVRHFGQGIVPRVFDFGRNGAPPTHPALLDWLAAEFTAPSLSREPQASAARGWSLKALHRLMVTSATYRMASTPDDACAALDRDNLYYWRMGSRRMEAEVVRDSLFHVAGKLDLTVGGPDLDHAQGLTLPRRSLYFRHAQEKQMEFLKIFDTASVVECYQRTTSVVPQQALALANSDLAIRNARLVARALHNGSEPTAFVQAAFEQVLSRPPTMEEQTECVAFLEAQAKLYGPARSPAVVVDERTPSPDPVLRARENLIRILMNHHDFVTIR